MENYVAIGSPKNHSGREFKIELELQVGDYVDFRDDENKDDDNGILIVITHRYYCTVDNALFFFGSAVS